MAKESPSLRDFFLTKPHLTSTKIARENELNQYVTRNSDQINRV